MQFSTLTLSLIAASALCSASPMPQNVAVAAVVPPSKTSTFSGTKAGNGKLTPKKAPGTQKDQALQKKQAGAGIVAVVTIKVATIIAKAAIEVAQDTLKSLSEWNGVREAFTQATTLEMWNRNPDFKKFHAAICYNKAYRVKNPAGIADLGTAKVELGLLNTDYDCMFMDAPNQFLTDSQGGFINLAYRYDDRCTFDANTGDLTCV